MTQTDMLPRFDHRTQCFLNEIRYDFNTRTGHLIMGEISATDMFGCIGIFKAVDPEVRQIITWRKKPDGLVQDTGYALIEGDEDLGWRAYLPPATSEPTIEFPEGF